MAVLLGSYTIPFLGVSIFIAALTFITYKHLRSYLHKWIVMKPIPEVGVTYPFIGNALEFKTDPGGRRSSCERLLQGDRWMNNGTVFFLFKSSFVKLKITHVSSMTHRWLSSGLEQCRLSFCFMLRPLRYSNFPPSRQNVWHLHVYMALTYSKPFIKIIGLKKKKKNHCLANFWEI